MSEKKNPKGPESYEKVSRGTKKKRQRIDKLKVLTNHDHVMERIQVDPVGFLESALDAEAVVRLMDFQSALIFRMAIEGHSVPEIAKSLKCSRRTVSRLKEYGIAVLKGRLAEDF